MFLSEYRLYCLRLCKLFTSRFTEALLLPAIQRASLLLTTERYPEPQRNVLFFFGGQIRDDKQREGLQSAAGRGLCERGRRILPTMAVLVHICNVFPGLRMAPDSVLAFQGRVLDSSAVFGTAGPLSCSRLAVYCPPGPSVRRQPQFIVILPLMLFVLH